MERLTYEGFEKKKEMTNSRENTKPMSLNDDKMVGKLNSRFPIVERELVNWKLCGIQTRKKMWWNVWKKIVIRKTELEAQFTCTQKETIERMGKRQYWKSQWLEIFKIKEKHAS